MERTHNRRRLRVWHIIALVVLGCTALGGGCVALIFSLTRPVVTASDSFMTALKDGDFEAAYEMGTPELRRELGSAQQLGSLFARSRPVSWSWSSRQIQNNRGNVSGRVTYSGGGESEVRVLLLSRGGEWRISGFRMNPR